MANSSAMGLSLAEGLVNIMTEISEARGASLEVFPHISYGATQLSSSAVARSCIEHAFDPNRVASDLWEHLQQADHQLCNANFVSDGTSWIRPKEPLSFKDASIAIQEVACDAVKVWAELWIKYFIAPIALKDRTPAATGATHTGQAQQTFREALYKRDGYICPPSGFIDVDAPEDSFRALKEQDILNNRTSNTSRFFAAHILPFSLNRKSETLSYIEKFTNGKVLATMLDAGNINNPANGFMASEGFSSNFELFRLSIEEVELEPDTPDPGPLSRRYKVVSFKPERTNNPVLPFGEPFVFGSHQLTSTPGSRTSLPSPRLIRLHRAVYGLLNACGAAEVVWKIIRDEADLSQPFSGFTLSTGLDRPMRQQKLFSPKLKHF